MPGLFNRLPGVAYAPPEEAAEHFRTGGWVDMTVGQALRQSAARHPGKAAFLSDERVVAFGELDELTDRLGAALLALGLESGDRAIFQMGTTVDTAIALLACYKVGIIPVCAVPSYREVEIGHLTSQSAARGYFVQHGLGSFDLVGFANQMKERHPTLQHIVAAGAPLDAAASDMNSLIAAMPLEAARRALAEVRVGPEDVLSFQLSGGTTGVPKIIPRFHGEYISQSIGWVSRIGVTPEDRLIYSLPLLHNAGQIYALIPPAYLGVTVVLMPRVDVGRMLELIEQHRVTYAMSIGPVAPQLIAYPGVARHDLSSLRLFVTISRADLLEAHIHVACSNLFGITEGLVLGSPPQAPARARHATQGASGCPFDKIRLLQPDSEEPVPIGEMGELCFKGPSSLRGYYNNPDASRNAFTSDGYYRSGDMMTAHMIDGKICYAFAGRMRDNINRGGEKIGCEEVEAYVSKHPSISDATLVPMPDPIYGEKACVFVIVRPGLAAPSVKDLADFLVGHGLAKFKCPERIESIEAFPVTRVGKLDKPALRRMIAEKITREGGS